jgi:hypothetical protein
VARIEGEEGPARRLGIIGRRAGTELVLFRQAGCW